MSVFETALGICQSLLAMDKMESGTPLTFENIASKVDEILAIPSFSKGVDREALIRQLEELFTTWANEPSAIGNDDDHKPWLSTKLTEIKWQFWSRYKIYLTERAKLGPIAVANVEKVTDEVLGRLEDPDRDGPWDRRGLVMGHVQSGKTATYTGLICKAADSGYKVIIVLAGLHNNLRSQTQIRLDEGFLGFKAVPPKTDSYGFEKTGVAEFGTGPKADSVTNRLEKGDFKKAFADQFGMHAGGNPLLFVVKKNVPVLKHLSGWINHSAESTDPETGRKFHRHIPLLIIDDEADQASVDTKTLALDEFGQPDEDHNPTITNQLIRSLLYAFDKSAYVGFTATPFANIFIHEQARTKTHGDDLFPRSFIVNLPAPSNYTGAARIFGIEEDPDAGLPETVPAPITYIISDHALTEKSDETQGWMPPKLVDKTDHIPLYDGERKIPPSLREAILCFIISTTVKKIRLPDQLFNSMLIHVTRFTKIQEIVREEVETELKNIEKRLEFGDGSRKPSIQDEFYSLWLNNYIPTSKNTNSSSTLPDWSVVSVQLLQVLKSIKVKSINGSALDSLDYELHKESGLSIIAIGGDKLSRGLTLEGLTVSYFLRSSKMYDTLMQMGRWFGYREKYLDLCRLYTTSELFEWFQHIATATEELRLEFDHMVNIGATPKEYGLRVRSHPAMLVTSAVKMKSGTTLSLSYAGDISETIIFNTAKSTIQNNLEATNHLLRSLGIPSTGERAGGYLWRNIVNSTTILDFLSLYESHNEAIRADTKLLSKYISKQNGQGELVEWSVKLASSGLKEAPDYSSCFGGLSVGAIFRAQNSAIEKNSKKFSIKRLVNPSDESADLSKDETSIALEKTRELWASSTRKNKPTEPPIQVSGRGIRFARPKKRGMLIIYPLDSTEAGLDIKIPIIGIAISFPNSNTAQEISYTVNNVFTKIGDYDEF
ncbi:MAG: Z1 domain-containing protein [Methylotenera sp.]|uniref:Z1 domain-containing protein n=1 Tax=Methylotenera sp. TaxID=2051956 RepID=UPI002733E8C5|nr:Z1 domain-containing protein [Methylotenera sp.]MDP2102094.1 Z1 domain-containing protein [Methylotenera sp.]MDP2281054.1 Z1 domain-containing protein [Methylotenera sp.]MDP3061149.1 Z1 domain-containing protein [Methylotenera sp.]MDP3210918.1 Z1 domain-containing protein [Methylotenera sp.]